MVVIKPSSHLANIVSLMDTYPRSVLCMNSTAVVFTGGTSCYPNNGDTKHFRNEDRTINELFRATQAKTRLLRATGYNVIEIWEC